MSGCSDALHNLSITSVRRVPRVTPPLPLPFASISCSSRNLGDDIQVLAGLQFLPSTTLFVDRDRLGRFYRPEPHRLLLNGWFTRDPAHWPPSPSLRPLITSIHLADDDLYGERSIEWMRDQSALAPIGARDTRSVELMRAHGIAAFYSGCLTLTLTASEPVLRTDQVAVVDLPDEAVALVRSRGANVIAPTHRLSRTQRLFCTLEKRLRAAAALLDTYRGSHAVVTRRLHAALPSLAFGTPVLFVTDDPQKRRFSGLIDHLKVVRLDDFLKGRFDFDFADPPSNSEGWRPIAQILGASVTSFTGLVPRPFDVALAEVLAHRVRRAR